MTNGRNHSAGEKRWGENAKKERKEKKRTVNISPRRMGLYECVTRTCAKGGANGNVEDMMKTNSLTQSFTHTLFLYTFFFLKSRLPFGFNVCGYGIAVSFHIRISV